MDGLSVSTFMAQGRCASSWGGMPDDRRPLPGDQLLPVGSGWRRTVVASRAQKKPAPAPTRAGDESCRAESEPPAAEGGRPDNSAYRPRGKPGSGPSIVARFGRGRRHGGRPAGGASGTSTRRRVDLRPPELLADALSGPHEGRLPSRPLPLVDALARATDREQQRQIAVAYWRLAIAQAQHALRPWQSGTFAPLAPTGA